MLPQIQLTGHNVDITDTLRSFIDDKFKRLTKHVERVTSIHVMLDFLKPRATATAKAKLSIPHSEIFAEAESEDMYKTIDLLIDKIVRQLDKHKTKK